MEELHSKTHEAGKKYLDKYNDLIKMVTGYEEISKHDDMKKVKGITSKIKAIIDKTMISEDEFIKLKKEQNEIMNEYADLEKLRTKSPFSKDSLEFSKNGSLSKSPDSGIEKNIKSEDNPIINDFNKKYTTDLSSLLTNFQKIEQKEELDKLESIDVCDSESHSTSIEDITKKQKLKCDGTINQYYKMPDINIQITNGKDDTITVKSRLDGSKSKKKIRVKSKNKSKSKKKYIKKISMRRSKKKCLDDKLNNHKVF